MKKYLFFQLKEQSQAGGLLPCDVNDFAHRYMLDVLNCPEASEVLKNKENKIQYGKILVNHEILPGVTIEFKVQGGMCTGYDVVNTKAISNRVADFTHINNPALDMSRPKRREHGKSNDGE